MAPIPMHCISPAAVGPAAVSAVAEEPRRRRLTRAVIPLPVVPPQTLVARRVGTPMSARGALAVRRAVATTVAQDWLANELAEYGEIDAACRDRFVMHLMTAAGASAPADAVFRFTAGEAMQTSRPTSASGEDDDEDADRSEEYSDDGRVSD